MPTVSVSEYRLNHREWLCLSAGMTSAILTGMKTYRVTVRDVTYWYKDVQAEDSETARESIEGENWLDPDNGWVEDDGEAEIEYVEERRNGPPTCHYCAGNMDDLSYSPYCGPQCAINAEKE